MLVLEALFWPAVRCSGILGQGITVE